LCGGLAKLEFESLLKIAKVDRRACKTK